MRCAPHEKNRFSFDAARYSTAAFGPYVFSSCLYASACSWQERAKDLAVQVLLDAVAGSNDSPLKRAVLSSGMAQEMDVALEDGIAQPFLAVQFKNIKDGCADKLLSLTRKTASEMVESSASPSTVMMSAPAFR